MATITTLKKNPYNPLELEGLRTFDKEVPGSLMLNHKSIRLHFFHKRKITDEEVDSHQNDFKKIFKTVGKQLAVAKKNDDKAYACQAIFKSLDHFEVEKISKEYGGHLRLPPGNDILGAKRKTNPETIPDPVYYHSGQLIRLYWTQDLLSHSGFGGFAPTLGLLHFGSHRESIPMLKGGVYAYVMHSREYPIIKPKIKPNLADDYPSLTAMQDVKNSISLTYYSAGNHLGAGNHNGAKRSLEDPSLLKDVMACFSSALELEPEYPDALGAKAFWASILVPKNARDKAGELQLLANSEQIRGRLAEEYRLVYPKKEVPAQSPQG